MGRSGPERVGLRRVPCLLGSAAEDAFEEGRQIDVRIELRDMQAETGRADLNGSRPAKPPPTPSISHGRMARCRPPRDRVRILHLTLLYPKLQYPMWVVKMPH
jgi:hypothetical protein